ncbi:MAG: hypothetical protein FGM54_02290 [Chitinophagaceae bacterium]|nr:hypothetical protein [Chitinophagaceae bacterium]
MGLGEHNNVFVYWVGKRYSLIELLRKIMKLHADEGRNYKFHFIDEHNLNQYVEELPPGFHRLLPAYQADYVRVAVIERFGGIWLDSDTLVMNNMHDLFKVFETHQGFFIRQNNNLVCNGVFGSKPGTALLAEWRKAMIPIIAEKGNNMVWSELGNLWLEQQYQEKTLFDDYIVYPGLDTVYPVNWDKCRMAYLEEPYITYKQHIREFQPIVMLIHTVYEALEDFEIPDILDADFPLNYFIKQSLARALKVGV